MTNLLESKVKGVDQIEFSVIALILSTQKRETIPVKEESVQPLKLGI